MKKYFILFPNQTNGIKLNYILTSENFSVSIVPTPRELSSSCGISLLIRKEDIEEIKGIIKRESIKILGIMPVENKKPI